MSCFLQYDPNYNQVQNTRTCIQDKGPVIKYWEGGGYNAGEGKFSFAPTRSVCVGGGADVLAMLTKRVEVVLTQELEVVAILKGAQKVLEPQFPHFVIPPAHN